MMLYGGVRSLTREKTPVGLYGSEAGLSAVRRHCLPHRGTQETVEYRLLYNGRIALYRKSRALSGQRAVIAFFLGLTATLPGTIIGPGNEEGRLSIHQELKWEILGNTCIHSACGEQQNRPVNLLQKPSNVLW